MKSLEGAGAGPLGVVWFIDAADCDEHRLRDETSIRALIARIVERLDLHPVAAPLVHGFPGEGGITALLLLSESHLAIHTFPEARAAALDLYCCRARPAFDWRSVLADHLGAGRVSVRTTRRGDEGA